MIQLYEMTDIHLLFLAVAVLILARALKHPLDSLFQPWDHYWVRRLARRLGLVDRPGAPFE